MFVNFDSRAKVYLLQPGKCEKGRSRTYTQASSDAEAFLPEASTPVAVAVL